MNYKNYKKLKTVTDVFFKILNFNDIIPSIRPFFKSQCSREYLEYVQKNFNVDKVFTQNFSEVLDNASLCIYFCDTTAFYNSLYLEIPSILIISDSFLKKGFRNKLIYKEMKKHNIIFTCPKKAANFIINLNKTGIDRWWLRKENLNFLKKLKSDHLYELNNRVKKLHKILKSYLK